MVVHIVSTNKDTPVTEEDLGMKAEESRSGLETFFGRWSCTAALVHNEMEMSSDVRFVGQPDGGECRWAHEKYVVAAHMESPVMQEDMDRVDLQYPRMDNAVCNAAHSICSGATQLLRTRR